MMKSFTFKQFIQYYLPLTLSLFMLITIEREVTTDGGFDKLYGLPLPYITSGCACSFCYDVFLPALIFDFLFWLLLTLSVFTLLQKIGLRMQTHWLFILSGAVICLWWIMEFTFLTYDSRFYFRNASGYETKEQHVTIELLNPQ